MISTAPAVLKKHLVRWHPAMWAEYVEADTQGKGTKAVVTRWLGDVCG